MSDRLQPNTFFAKTAKKKARGVCNFYMVCKYYIALRECDFHSLPPDFKPRPPERSARY